MKKISLIIILISVVSCGKYGNKEDELNSIKRNKLSLISINSHFTEEYKSAKFDIKCDNAFSNGSSYEKKNVELTSSKYEISIIANKNCMLTLNSYADSKGVLYTPESEKLILNLDKSGNSYVTKEIKYISDVGFLYFAANSNFYLMKLSFSKNLGDSPKALRNTIPIVELDPGYFDDSSPDDPIKRPLMEKILPPKLKDLAVTYTSEPYIFTMYGSVIASTDCKMFIQKQYPITTVYSEVNKQYRENSLNNKDVFKCVNLNQTNNWLRKYRKQDMTIIWQNCMTEEGEMKDVCSYSLVSILAADF